MIPHKVVMEKVLDLTGFENDRGRDVCRATDPHDHESLGPVNKITGVDFVMAGGRARSGQKVKVTVELLDE